MPKQKRVFRAIITKWLPVTATKPQRITGSAGDAASRVTLSVYALEESLGRVAAADRDTVLHLAMAEKVRDKMGWNSPVHGRLVSGCLPNGDYVHVMLAAALTYGIPHFKREGRSILVDSKEALHLELVRQAGSGNTLLAPWQADSLAVQVLNALKRGDIVIPRTLADARELGD